MEGPSAIEDALRAGVVETLFVSTDHPDPTLAARATEAGARVTECEPRVMRALADTTTPQGLLAVARMPAEDDPLGTARDLVLILDEVRDPGNAGTLVRTAVAAGAQAVVFSAASVDPYHPKTVRAAAGSLFHIGIARSASLGTVGERLGQAGFTILGLEAEAGMGLDDAELAQPVALVVGNEAGGLTEAGRAIVDVGVRIDMPGPVESLNAAVAGSIALFEVARRRRA